MKKRQLPKTVAVIIICVLIDIALLSVTSAYSTMPANPNYSKLAALFGTEITATLWAIFAFSGAAWVFYRIQNSIPGDGVAKGLRYGTGNALLRKRGAAKFILFFAVNWTTFLIFMPLLFSGFLTDVLFRIVLDISLVTIGYYLAFAFTTRSI